MRRLMVASLFCVAASAQASRPASAPARPGTRLVFRVELAVARERGWVRPGEANHDVLREVVMVVRRCLDPDGKLGVTVQAEGPSVAILLPELPPERVDEMIDQVTSSGSVELRLVADDRYRRDQVAFDLARERERLATWLKVRGNRAAVLADPAAILRFNAGAGTEEGPVSRYLMWYPEYAVRVDLRGTPGNQRTVWRAPRPIPGAVKLQDPDPDNLDPPGFVPLNLHEAAFLGRDLVFEALKRSERGDSSITFGVSPQKRGDWSELTARSIGSALAVLHNGMVVVAPELRSQITGAGEIALPGFTTQAVNALTAAMKTLALRAPLVLVSREAVPR